MRRFLCRCELRFQPVVTVARTLASPLACLAHECRLVSDAPVTCRSYEDFMMHKQAERRKYDAQQRAREAADTEALRNATADTAAVVIHP